MKFHPMKSLAIATLTFALAACDQSDNAANKPQTEKPLVVQVATANSASLTESFTFPAKIRAFRNVDIAFQVPGKVDYLQLIEGTEIPEGTLMAALDAGPFERNFRQSEVKLTQAKAELKRIQALVDKNIASQQDMDNAKAAHDLAVIEWENRKADLAYSQLKAPFNAKISKRHVEKGTYVGVGKPIVSLQDVSKVYFEIQVPERIVSAHQGEKVNTAKAYIGGSLNQWFDVTYAEHNTIPDATTQTYKVVFSMPQPKAFNLSTGINASVKIDAPVNGHMAVFMPVHALVAEGDNQFYLWRMNQETSRVEKVAVKVGPIANNFVPVLSGISSGDKIVVAGIANMRENLLVQAYKGE